MRKKGPAGLLARAENEVREINDELYSKNVGVEFVERAGIDVNQLIDKLRKAAAAELFQS